LEKALKDKNEAKISETPRLYGTINGIMKPISFWHWRRLKQAAQANDSRLYFPRAARFGK
jgi:hypothetical protein